MYELIVKFGKFGLIPKKFLFGCLSRCSCRCHCGSCDCSFSDSVFWYFKDSLSASNLLLVSILSATQDDGYSMKRVTICALIPPPQVHTSDYCNNMIFHRR